MGAELSTSRPARRRSMTTSEPVTFSVKTRKNGQDLKIVVSNQVLGNHNAKSLDKSLINLRGIGLSSDGEVEAGVSKKPRGASSRKGSASGAACDASKHELQLFCNVVIIKKNMCCNMLENGLMELNYGFGRESRRMYWTNVMTWCAKTTIDFLPTKITMVQERFFLVKVLMRHIYSLKVAFPSMRLEMHAFTYTDKNERARTSALIFGNNINMFESTLQTKVAYCISNTFVKEIEA
ncbi:hypothetical protein Scep_007499 [Stephania cephalantha]|uniref:Uncharacterized protein n=1 Tax=Stephania cephalantha TaxID=152367 RepID=A0AAP0KCQ9_9MAGN